MATFIISQMPNGNFKFYLQAANGETLLFSETYTSKDGAINGINSVKSNSPRRDRYLPATKDGHFYFKLRGANGEILCSSELYTTAAARDNGILAVMNMAISAKVEDDIAEEFPALKTTAQLVKEKRKQLGITQEELAVKAGVGVRFIRELEAGEKMTLRIDKVNEVLKLFGYSLGPVKTER